MREQGVRILRAVSVQNVELSSKIGGLIISVYSGMNQRTLTGFSWPSRIVTAEMTKLFHCNADFKKFDATYFDLEYVNPVFHAELMKCVVEAVVPFFWLASSVIHWWLISM